MDSLTLKMPEMMYHRCLISVIILMEDSAIYAFVIRVFKMASRGPNFGGKNGTHFFSTKSVSKNNFKPKN